MLSSALDRCTQCLVILFLSVCAWWNTESILIMALRILHYLYLNQTRWFRHRVYLDCLDTGQATIHSLRSSFHVSESSRHGSCWHWLQVALNRGISFLRTDLNSFSLTCCVFYLVALLKYSDCSQGKMLLCPIRLCHKICLSSVTQEVTVHLSTYFPFGTPTFTTFSLIACTMVVIQWERENVKGKSVLGEHCRSEQIRWD